MISDSICAVLSGNPWTQEHPRPWRVKDRAILVGDAAGYVTKCSGEGIYFAAKSGRMWPDTSFAKQKLKGRSRLGIGGKAVRNKGDFT